MGSQHKAVLPSLSLSIICNKAETLKLQNHFISKTPHTKFSSCSVYFYLDVFQFCSAPATNSGAAGRKHLNCQPWLCCATLTALRTTESSACCQPQHKLTAPELGLRLCWLRGHFSNIHWVCLGIWRKSLAGASSPRAAMIHSISRVKHFTIPAQHRF